MADQNNVRQIALSLPETVEAEDRFAFSVPNRGKLKGVTCVWYERIEPKKPRVPRRTSSRRGVANLEEKAVLLSMDPTKFIPSLPNTSGFLRETRAAAQDLT